MTRVLRTELESSVGTVNGDLLLLPIIHSL